MNTTNYLATPNTITFDSTTNPNWEHDLTSIVLLLCRNGYTTETYYEDAGIWVVHYDYKDPNLACTQCIWIDPLRETVVEIEE